MCARRDLIFTITVNPPIYNSVLRDLGINPFTPLERYKAYGDLKYLKISIN